MRLIAIGFVSCLALAQSTTVSQARRSIGASMGFAGTAYALPAITGAPYSAQEVTDHTQTLTDGTHINQKPRMTLLYRDSQGRTRTERSIGPPDANVSVVEINDPVAGFRYVLDPDNKVVHRTALTQFSRGMPTASAASGTFIASPPPPPSHPSPATAGTGATGAIGAGPMSLPPSSSNPVPTARLQHSTEQLGSQTMEGVTVEGRRDTTTIPIGLQGNDQPMTTVTEMWTSPQLHLVISRKMTDPRSGTTTTRMENLVAAEPDPTLFLPPSDYTITDETGSFQIHFSR